VAIQATQVPTKEQTKASIHTLPTAAADGEGVAAVGGEDDAAGDDDHAERYDADDEWYYGNSTLDSSIPDQHCPSRQVRNFAMRNP